MDTVSGYEMSCWARGYGDFVMKPDLDTLRPIPWHEGTVHADGRPRVGGRLRRRGVAAADPAAPARPARRARLDRGRRHGARVHPLQRHLRGGVAQGLPRPRAGQPLQRRLLDARHRAGGAADPAHPQLDAGRRACASRTRRASATSASTRSTSATTTRWPPPTTTRSTRPAPRRSPRRRATRSPSSPSSTSARATRATSTARSRTRTAAACSPTTSRPSTASWPASSRACAS